jgi:hypothetical protein
MVSSLRVWVSMSWLDREREKESVPGGHVNLGDGGGEQGGYKYVIRSPIEWGHPLRAYCVPSQSHPPPIPDALPGDQPVAADLWMHHLSRLSPFS